MSQENKHKHFKKLHKTDRAIGLSLLVLGGILLIISLIINLVFIRGTDFRREYRLRQHQDCLQNNSVAKCDKEFAI